METKQEIKLEDVFNDEKRQAIKEFIDKQEIKYMIPVSELEDFFYESCEDYHLWDETEDGPYPVQRILNAMGKFLKKKQEEIQK